MPFRSATTVRRKSSSEPIRPTPVTARSWPAPTRNPPGTFTLALRTASATSFTVTPYCHSLSDDSRTWYCLAPPPIDTAEATPGTDRRRGELGEHIEVDLLEKQDSDHQHDDIERHRQHPVLKRRPRGPVEHGPSASVRMAAERGGARTRGEEHRVDLALAVGDHFLSHREPLLDLHVLVVPRPDHDRGAREARRRLGEDEVEPSLGHQRRGGDDQRVRPSADHDRELNEHVLLQVAAGILDLGPHVRGPALGIDLRMDEGDAPLEPPAGIRGHHDTDRLADPQLPQEILRGRALHDQDRRVDQFQERRRRLHDLAEDCRPVHDNAGDRGWNVEHRHHPLPPHALDVGVGEPEQPELSFQPFRLCARGQVSQLDLALEPRNLVLHRLELVLGRDQLLPGSDALVDQLPVTVRVSLREPQLVAGLREIGLELQDLGAGAAFRVEEVKFELLHLDTLDLDQIGALLNSLTEGGVDVHDLSGRPARHERDPLRCRLDHTRKAANVVERARRHRFGLEADVRSLDRSQRHDRTRNFVVSVRGCALLMAVAALLGLLLLRVFRGAALAGCGPIRSGRGGLTARLVGTLLLGATREQEADQEQAAREQHRPAPRSRLHGRAPSARYSSAVAAFPAATASRYASRPSMNSRSPTKTSVILSCPRVYASRSSEKFRSCWGRMVRAYRSTIRREASTC